MAANNNNNAADASISSPTDSVILDASIYDSFANNNHVAKSDALSQPLVSLTSRLKDHLETWSIEGSLSQNIDQFLDMVATNRLKHMPHKGSKWDRFLQRSVAFAGQIHRYDDTVSETLLGSDQATAMIYSCLHVIIEVRMTMTNGMRESC